ncbi:hypothetical protein MAMC_00939 [Methylacidimicrobium cyclopophantes]|uniref:Uncharacterized protein n=1 Tax=Methylacidimicrobium cyclopophantes TaxID=1041766 RepID=A0A5E6MJ48_9BACT|nr:hypothetical protein [Methylacidimicrobium cyclopophantes]VVM06086.1 hypothetical protein MAMC_00939 [Methylacidimicrobium cyclopophantes]
MVRERLAKIGILLAALVGAIPADSWACAVCGVPKTQATRGILPAVILMLVLLGIVFGAFIRFFIRANRSRNQSGGFNRVRTSS